VKYHAESTPALDGLRKKGSAGDSTAELPQLMRNLPIQPGHLKINNKSRS
jgi:hypothetical protein